jgi:hypothetical protein
MYSQFTKNAPVMYFNLATFLKYLFSVYLYYYFWNLTFRGPCIVIYSYNKNNEMHYFSNLFGEEFYMFRTDFMFHPDLASRRQHNQYDKYLLL